MEDEDIPMEETSVTDKPHESVNDKTVKSNEEIENESDSEKIDPLLKKQEANKEKNPDSDESDDENKPEKMNLEKSFDLSSDEDDEEEELDGIKTTDLNVFNNEAAILGEAKVNTDASEKKTDTEMNKSSEASSSKKTNDEGKDEAQKKKSQATDNSVRELARKKKLEQMEEENKRMQVLMANFSEEQLNRYEVFRRSAFQKSTVKKIIQTVGGKTVSASVVIAMSGIAKVFIGEVTEKALDVKEKWGDTGPLQPKHLREAYRLVKNESKVTTSLRTKNPSIF